LIALSKSSLSNFSITRLYKGFSVNLFSNTLYWTFTLSMYEKLNNHFNNKKEKYNNDFEYLPFYRKISIIFGATTVNAVFISFILYPLDTFKRHLQVNSAIGFNSEYNSMSDAINKFWRNGVKDMYR
jgi:hypothetical protein